MSDPQNPNDPFNQQSGNQPWGQQSANQPESQPWGQQSANPPADQWGGQSGQYGSTQADPQAGQWSQQQDPYGQQHYDQQQYGQQQSWSGPGQQSGMLGKDGKGLFAALFDFSFNSFVTPKIIKVVYVVVTAAIGLGVLFFLISALATGDPLTIIGALILGPLVGLIYLALSRMTLELYYAVVRLSEDVHERLPRS